MGKASTIYVSNELPRSFCCTEKRGVVVNRIDKGVTIDVFPAIGESFVCNCACSCMLAVGLGALVPKVLCLTIVRGSGWCHRMAAGRELSACLCLPHVANLCCNP